MNERRAGAIARTTNETSIELTIDLDGGPDRGAHVDRFSRSHAPSIRQTQRVRFVRCVPPVTVWTTIMSSKSRYFARQGNRGRAWREARDCAIRLGDGPARRGVHRCGNRFSGRPYLNFRIRFCAKTSVRCPPRWSASFFARLPTTRNHAASHPDERARCASRVRGGFQRLCARFCRGQIATTARRIRSINQRRARVTMLALAVIDYGGGNLGSLVAALARRRARFAVTERSRAAHRRARSAAIFPATAPSPRRCDAARSADWIARSARISGAEVRSWGSASAWQVLFEGSDEFGDARRSRRAFRAAFRVSRRAAHTAHGLEQLGRRRRTSVRGGLGANEYAYFLHSYRAPVGPDDGRGVLRTASGLRQSSRAENVMGTQFHPGEEPAHGRGVFSILFSALHVEAS